MVFLVKNNGTVFKQKKCKLKLFYLSLFFWDRAFYIVACDYNFLFTFTESEGRVIKVVVFVLYPMEHHVLCRF